MRIDKIVPYKRNARNNEKAVPVVAESIKEFGLKGQIVLESRENPVIVCGHTRVAACKLLGWDEIPDERIDFCDGLTDEQIRALRIADNKTGDVATYNRSMLREEVRGIKALDMSRFNVDFKSRFKPKGFEALRTDKVYHLDLLNADDCDERGYPCVPPVDVVPDDFVGFNYAKSMPEEDKAGKACHFFKDDYQFERCWNDPLGMLPRLKGFECVLTPDFSVYFDMPEPMKRWNRFRSQFCGKVWSDLGITVVPTLRWAYPDSYEYCFAGIPRRSTVAVSTTGMLADPEEREVWRDGMRYAMDLLEPTRVLLYGDAGDFDFGPTEVIRYKSRELGA